MASGKESPTSKNTGNENLAVPIPVRKLAAGNNSTGDGGRPWTPNTELSIQKRRRPSYGTIETDREAHYNLDYPVNEEELLKHQLDPKSRFFARSRPRSLNLPSLLPYQPENPKDRAKFLSHIVAHLYIAVKSLDIQGSVLITAKDLASLRNVAGLSDIDLALETNLFEMNNEQARSTDDEETNTYFSHEDLDVEDEEEDEYEDDSEMDDEEELKESVDDFDSGETSQHKKLPKSAAVVSVRIWTHELLVWLKMKYDMPLTLRMALARVYYAICCCRGQHLNLRVYIKTFELLTKDVDLLQDAGFTLPWEPVYLELVNHFPGVDASFESFEKKDMNLLLKLAERSSSFYPQEALPEIFKHLGSKFSIPNASLVLSTMCMLPLTLQKDAKSETDIRHYLSALFFMWSKLSRSNGVDSHLTSRLDTIAMAFLTKVSKDSSFSSQHGPYGVFTEGQFLHLINALINSLSINVQKFGSLKTKFFHGYSSAIVFSINGESSLERGGIMEHIETLLNAIESYVHPSNSGEWSRPISKFILSLIYQFQKRYNLENQATGNLYSLPDQHKLSKKLVERFVRDLLPIVRTGIQSKKASAVDDYLVCLNLLASMDAEQVLSSVLTDLYESLEGVISTHRVVTALRSLDELVRYFANTPIYRVHLTRLFTLALPGIDSNDLTKTMHTLEAFAAMASFVPIHDLTDGDGDSALAIQFTSSQLEYLQSKLYSNDADVRFDVTPELEEEALKSSSTAFKLLMKTFLERVFLLLRNIPDPSKSNGLEKDLCDCLPKFLFIMIESMSDDIFKCFREEVFNFVLDYSVHTIADVVGEICGGLIKRDPKYFKQIAPTLIDRVIEEVSENGAGKVRTGIDVEPLDQPLFWNLIILNECIGNAGKYVVALGPKLNKLSYFLMDNVKGSVVFASTYMLNQMLQAVTKMRINETRLINPAYVARNGVDANCWGGFQFDDYRFSRENLTFDWFIPDEECVRFAVDTFKAHISKALQKILGVLRDIIKNKEGTSQISLDLSDELRVHLLYLGYGVSGSSYLFDPSFDEDIPKLNDHKYESLQHRLLLLKQLRDLKSTKFSTKDEARIESVQENLQKIVDDIEGKDIIDFTEDLEKVFDIDMSGYLHSHKSDSNESIDEKQPTFKKPIAVGSLSQSDSPINESARATPMLGGVNLTTLNPAITFRERKLYTSRYFFGDDIEQRRANEMYLEVHRTRHLVGKSLHIIFKFLTTHLYDNIRIFKHLLYVLDIWFADVGRERNLDYSHSRISFTYLNDIQELNRVRKPFTRLTFGSRIESYHQMRVALHATSRNMSDLDKILIEDLTKASCSTYLAISDRAQATLLDAMKRVNNSYNVIVRTAFKILSRALEEDNHKKIESGLSIFQLKRIKSKMQGDFSYLGRYIDILHRSMLVDRPEVSELAQRLFQSLSGTICLPSKVCLIDHEMVDSIRPPDEFIDLEIKAVTLAKEKKREVYADKFEKIEDAVVTNEKQNNHWKLSSLNLQCLIDLQVDFDAPTRNDVFQILTKASSSDHPLIVRLALKGISKLLNKLFLLGAYNYNLSNAYDLSFVMRDFKIVDTKPKNNMSYAETWRQEVTNFDTPDYYIDHKASSGWLFWDDSMIAVRPEPNLDLNLREQDQRVLAGFASCVTSEWFHNIVNLWVTDNEANSAFQGTDVFATAGLVSLISNGIVETLRFDDLINIIKDIYVEDEKSSHIVICELISGLLIASKFTSPELAKKRDEFLVAFLTNLFENDLTPETKNIWTIFSWWIPSHVDCKRFPEVLKVLIDFRLDNDSNSALIKSTRLSYIRSVVASMTWAYPSPGHILELCFKNLTNKSQAIREQIGSLIAVTSFSFYGESMKDCASFVQACNEELEYMYRRSMEHTLFQKLPDLFEQVEAWRLQVKDLSAHEILNSEYICAATTILSWLNQALNTSIAIQYQEFVSKYIAPFLLHLTAMKDVCQLGNIEPISTFKKVSQIPFESKCLEEVVVMLEKLSKDSLNNVQFFILGEFIETIYFKNLFFLSKLQRQRIFDLTVTLMYHKNLEIREAASSTFSGLVHTSPPSVIDELVEVYKNRFAADLDRVRKQHRKTGFKNVSNAETIIMHGATLGLGALVHAFSFQSPPPPWIPELLTLLSNKASGVVGAVGRTAKETLGKFKKTRQDTWHVDSKVFSESQMQDLEGVLWKSYFI